MFFRNICVLEYVKSDSLELFGKCPQQGIAGLGHQRSQEEEIAMVEIGVSKSLIVAVNIVGKAFNENPKRNESERICLFAKEEPGINESKQTSMVFQIMKVGDFPLKLLVYNPLIDIYVKSHNKAVLKLLNKLVKIDVQDWQLQIFLDGMMQYTTLLLILECRMESNTKFR